MRIPRLPGHPPRPAAALLALTLVLAPAFAPAQDVQGHVHAHGAMVMPFDLGQTLHVFQMTTDGGVQKVVLRSGGADDAGQLPMIRHHLQMEAAAFQGGDYGDPARLHGAAMPGLAELQAGAAAIQVSYEALPDGAQIRFHADDIRLVTAIHRWFGAQLSEHGADARAE